MPVAPLDSPKKEYFISNFRDGLNSYAPENSIADSSLTVAQNCLIEEDGVLTRRPGITRVGNRSNGTSVGVHDHIIDMIAAGEGVKKKVYLLWSDADNTAAYKSFVYDAYDGQITDPDAWLGPAITVSFGVDHGSLTWGRGSGAERIYVCGAEDNQVIAGAIVYMTVTDAGTLPGLGVVANSPEYTRTITSCFNRVFTGGALGDAREELYYSAFRDGDVWDTTAFREIFTNRDGQAIIGLAPFRNDAIFVGLERSCWLLSVNTAESVAKFAPLNVSQSIGCGSHKTIRSVGQDLFFMDQHGNIQSVLLLLGERQSPAGEAIPVSLPIKDATDDISEDDIQFANAEFYKGNYWLSFKRSTGWTCYSFNASTQRWTGPHVFKNSSGNTLEIWAMAASVGDLGTDNTTSRSTHLYLATDDGQSDLDSLQVYELDETATKDDGATAIDMIATTGSIEFSLPPHEKALEFAEVTFEKVSGSTGSFSFEARKDFSDWVNLGRVVYNAGTPVIQRFKRDLKFLKAGRGFQFRFKSSDANTDPRILSLATRVIGRPVKGG